MARKLNAQQVRSLLAKAEKPKAYSFLLQIENGFSKARAPKKSYYVRLKGRNGEIVMVGELLNDLGSARNVCARIIESGMKVKFQENVHDDH